MRFRGPLDTPSRLYTGRVGVSCLISFYCPHDILSYIFSFLLTFLNYVIVYHRRFFLYYIILYYLAELSWGWPLELSSGHLPSASTQCWMMWLGGAIRICQLRHGGLIGRHFILRISGWFGHPPYGCPTGPPTPISKSNRWLNGFVRPVLKHGPRSPT
jgi:hypothetical protein